MRLLTVYMVCVLVCVSAYVKNGCVWVACSE